MKLSHSDTSGCGNRRTARPQAAAAIVALLVAVSAAAQNQTFYLPLPEAQLIQSLYAINTGVGLDPVQIHRITNVAIATNNARVYYDKAENGYAADIFNPTVAETYANPGNLNGVQIWGDGNAANGIPPGFASDVLNSGSVIILDNPNGNSGLYDGGDKVGVVGRAGVVMLAYPNTIGTVFCGGTEILDTASYGTDYRMAVGISNTGSTPDAHAWDLTEAYVLAAQDGTTVSLNGVSQGTINQGQSLRLTGLNRGAQITASAPVGAIQFTGYPTSTYEMRWEAMLPTGGWTNDYVLTGVTGDFTSAAGPYPKTQHVYLYAPSSTTVSYTRGDGTTGTLTVDNTNTLTAGTRNYLQVPENNGVRFQAPAGTTFWGVSLIGQQIDDEGVPLTPTSFATETIIVPQGYGCTGGVCGATGTSPNDLTAERSAVFITPVAPTASNITIYVDYDGLAGPRSPVSYVVGGLDTVRLVDADQDMTGALIYTLDGTKLTGVWLQFSTITGDAYGLDLGTLAIPAATVVDYGDAPISYGSAAHRVVPTLRLGTLTDFETGYAGSATALIDDDNYNGGATVAYASAQDNVGVGTAGNSTGTCDGVWTGGVAAGDRLSLQFTTLMSTGDWFRIRARSGDAGGADETATVSFCAVANGTCAATTVTLTVQDLDTANPGPDKYYDFQVPSGVTSLGWLRIVRTAGDFDVDCAATMKSAPVDDEDGAPVDGAGNLLLSFPKCSLGSTYTVNVLANNSSGAGASLVGYLDWNRDGTFGNNTNEESATVTVPNNTTNGVFAVTWSSVPANCGGTATTYARFRLASAAAEAQAPTGLAVTGEVEDYKLDDTTMPVTVASLSAAREGGSVRFAWTTSSEVGCAGFNVYGKNASGAWQRLNNAIVPAAGGGLEPRAYTLRLDVPREITEFYLEDLGLNGSTAGHRVSATLAAGPGGA